MAYCECEAYNEMFRGFQASLLGFHFQDMGRSGDREIWPEIQIEAYIRAMSGWVLLCPSVGLLGQQQTEFQNFTTSSEKKKKKEEF